MLKKTVFANNIDLLIDKKKEEIDDALKMLLEKGKSNHREDEGK